jgi:hypothetical protein
MQAMHAWDNVPAPGAAAAGASSCTVNPAAAAAAVGPQLGEEATQVEAAVGAAAAAAAMAGGTEEAASSSSISWLDQLPRCLGDPPSSLALQLPELEPPSPGQLQLLAQEQHCLFTSEALIDTAANEQQGLLLPAAPQYAAPADDEDDSSSDISSGLLDAAISPSCHELQDWNDSTALLSNQLLALYAGMHGSKSIAAGQSLLQRISQHNTTARMHNARQVLLRDIKESWFLQRPLMHLAVSKVVVWGPAALRQPDGQLTGEQRQLLLHTLVQTVTLEDTAASSAASSSSRSKAAVRQLLECTNRNRASVFFTACHFSIPEALQFLLGLPELGWRQMLRSTKRGKPMSF